MKQKVYKVYDRDKQLIFITESKIDLDKIIEQWKLKKVFIK